MADLVGGKYAQSNPLAGLLAGLSNVVQANIPPATNLAYGIGNISDGALAASGVLVAVPIPVDVGVTYSKVSIFVGATAASTPTHQFAALYSAIATPALIANSADATTTAIAASGIYTFTLATALTVTSAQAPNGFIYAGVSITGTTIPTAASLATPTGVNYQWTSSGPLYLSMTAGSALAGTPAATIASPAAKAVAPIIVLT